MAPEISDIAQIPYVGNVWVDKIVPALPRVISALVFFAILFVVYSIITKIIKKVIVSRARTKEEKHNAVIFMSIWKYFFVFFLILAVIFISTGSFAGLGISAGLLTAALGWALQRPITGIAGWVLVAVKKPFHIGDRILIGDVKGDVSDITLTHIYLKELGGTVPTEETSGRVVMIPNSVLFEQNIINYTMQDDFILDQVEFLITYESNLDKAVNIALDSVKEVIKPWKKQVSTPEIRTYFKPSGITIVMRYFTKTDIRTKVSSDLTQEVYKRLKNQKGVEIAYPHMDVLFSGKNKK